MIGVADVFIRRHTVADEDTVQLQQMDERVLAMYRSVRDVLSKYRSGKLPKAFKIIPSLSNWEQVCKHNFHCAICKTWP